MTAGPATAGRYPHLEVRFHGRGGQGVVTTAELLSAAAFRDGRHAQAFPSFGSERMGAPVVSFCRVSTHLIRTHEPVVAPHLVVVQDPTLLAQPDVLAGLRPDGQVLVNTWLSPERLALGVPVSTIDASAIARTHLGRPLPGTALLGAAAALTGAVSLGAVVAAVLDRFPGAVGEANAAAVRAAYDAVSGAPSDVAAAREVLRA